MRRVHCIAVQLLPHTRGVVAEKLMNVVADDGVRRATVALHVVMVAVSVAESVQKVRTGQRAGHLINYITTRLSMT